MYDILRQALFQMNPERAHRLTSMAGGLAQKMMPDALISTYRYEHDALRQKCLGHTFENPVGLAAGFDKNAELLPLWQQLGFGFAEIGSVTAKPSSGNPTPRLFRLEADKALINRMGLNNDGGEIIAERVKGLDLLPTFHLGINIAKTPDADILGDEAIEDYVTSYRLLARHCAYITLNISCPNTSSGKTFEDPRILDELLTRIHAARQHFSTALFTPPAILVKLSPPYNERVSFDSAIEDIIAVSLQHRVDGFIATNTASDRRGCTTSSATLEQIGEGGLSGAPLRKRSTALVRYIYEMTDGDIPIIGVGGIDSAQAAYEKICAGASLVQLYTGLVYQGPNLPKSIKKGLVELLDQDGHSNITEAIGSTSRRSHRVDTH